MNILKEKLTSKLTRPQLKKFLEKRSSEKYTLDLGCKDGPYSDLFPNRVGVDIEEGKGVDIIADAHDLPFENEKFEIILCTEVLEHLHSPKEAIKEMHRVLKKEGKLILTTRFVYPLHDTPHDYYRYTKYGLQYLFKDGWDILEMKEELNTQNTIASLLQRIGKQCILRLDKISKTFLFCIAKIIYFLPNIIKKEFGDISRSKEENTIMATGYYLVCKKK